MHRITMTTPDDVTVDTRRVFKPFWAKRRYESVYHDPCDDGDCFGDGHMSWSDGSRTCVTCGRSFDASE